MRERIEEGQPPIARPSKERTLPKRVEGRTSISRSSDQEWSRLQDFIFDSAELARSDRRETLSTDEVERYLLEMERLIQRMRDSLMETPSLDEFLRQLDGVLDKRSRTVSTAGSQTRQVPFRIPSLDYQGEEEEFSFLFPVTPYPGGGPLDGSRPRTRSRGRAQEEKWVMPRAIEHQKKGRPRRRR